MVNKKTCKKIKGKKYCNKEPLMNARDIIRIKMNAFKNNKDNSGIKLAYNYASRNNKKQTGPFNKFKKMINNEIYKHLLNNKSWKFLPHSDNKIRDEIYSSNIEVLSNYDNKKHKYKFKQKQPTY